MGGGLGLEPLLGRLIERDVPAGRIGTKIVNMMHNYLHDRRPGGNLKEFVSRHASEGLRVYLNEVGKEV